MRRLIMQQQRERLSKVSARHRCGQIKALPGIFLRLLKRGRILGQSLGGERAIGPPGGVTRDIVRPR
jgi:hypothetical protein